MKQLYPWQLTDYKSLLQPHLQGRLSHALILTGLKGIGKRHLANILSLRLLCESPLENGFACGQCHSCSMLESGSHPDSYIVQPEEKSEVIKIEQIRELTAKIILASHSGQYKVVIIDPADKMTIAAANSLLKTLEEPPDKTLFLLITSDVSRLPVTIRSRCQQINIPTPDPLLAESWLAEKQASSVPAAILLSLVSGAPLAALSLSEQKQLENRDKMLEEWCQLPLGKLDPVQIAAKWVKPDPQLPMIWIQGWIIDMIRLNTKYQKVLTNPDKKANLLSVAGLFDLARLFKLLEKVEECQNLINTQINAQSLLEGILIYWCHLPGKQKNRGVHK